MCINKPFQSEHSLRWIGCEKTVVELKSHQQWMLRVLRFLPQSFFLIFLSWNSYLASISFNLKSQIKPKCLKSCPLLTQTLIDKGGSIYFTFCMVITAVENTYKDDIFINEESPGLRYASGLASTPPESNFWLLFELRMAPLNLFRINSEPNEHSHCINYSSLPPKIAPLMVFLLKYLWVNILRNSRIIEMLRKNWWSVGGGRGCSIIKWSSWYSTGG